MTKVDRFKKIGITKGFGSNNKLRIEAYCTLIGYGGGSNNIESIRNNDRYKDNTIAYKCKWTSQIRKDVSRNQYIQSRKKLNINITNEIEKLLNIIYSEHRDLEYIQSFDSVSCLFYHISDGNISIAKKVCVSFFKVFKADLMNNSVSEYGFFESKTIWKLLKTHDSEFCTFLQSIVLANPNEISSVIFGIHWYLSWFVHGSMTNLNDILRVFDFMIATQNEKIGIYMIISVLLLNRNEMMKQINDECDLAYFIRHKVVYNPNQMILKCRQLLSYEKQSTWEKIFSFKFF
eukprot:282140_1